MANCPKCIIDGGKISATARYLVNSVDVWQETIEELYDPSKSPKPLTDEEQASIVATSQEWCDMADAMNVLIKKSNDTLCTIAVAHSHTAP